MEKSWFVLQTKPQKEELVERKLAEMRAATFLPRMHVYVRAGRHRQKRIAPMFPGYLFVQIDPIGHPLPIRYVPGVRDFIRGEGAPQSVPPQIVEALRDRIGPKGVFEPPPVYFEPGERLRIKDGPLQGLEAVFEREMSGADRVSVLLAAINLPARVILSRHSLSPC
jgi:transcriptional antiterminator RfaH